MNLEVILPGSRPKKPLLVIGAHYDSAPGTPGADDNASAIAVLLEIARHLSTLKLKRSVRLVLYDCEEPPHFNFGEMGSQFHAQSLRKAGVRIMGMICLESLGYFTRSGDSQPGTPWPLRWFTRLVGARHIVLVTNVRSIAFGLRFLLRFATSGLFPFLPASLPVKWVPAIELSDHRGYWEQGYPALMVTDTAFLRNPNYHQASDRLATLDFERMTRLCRQLCRTTARCAGNKCRVRLGGRIVKTVRLGGPHLSYHSRVMP